MGRRARGTSDAATIGVVVVFIEYINKFFIPIRDLSAKYAVMQGAMAASERIFQLLDTEELDGQAAGDGRTTAADAPAEPNRAAPAIELAGVHFSYGAEPVLRGVDLRVPRGATVAVVGATGSGKSTVIKLLTRLYERDRGSIKLDGVDIRDLRATGAPTADHGRLAGLHPVRRHARRQHRARASRTNARRLEEAVHRVGLDRALSAVERTSTAAVAERGSNFSAGERQLVAFARALLARSRDPRSSTKRPRMSIPRRKS